MSPAAGVTQPSKPCFPRPCDRAAQEAAFEKITGLSAKELSRQWHDAIRAQYAPILGSASRASASGRLVTPDQKNDRALAVSPVLSPDGSRVVYLSERDMLSIDLYLADATTGRIIRKLVNTAIDPHFSSIQFISSAGTWDPRGKQFAIGAIARGRPVLAIIDVDSGRPRARNPVSRARRDSQSVLVSGRPVDCVLGNDSRTYGSVRATTWPAARRGG